MPAGPRRLMHHSALQAISAVGLYVYEPDRSILVNQSHVDMLVHVPNVQLTLF